MEIRISVGAKQKMEKWYSVIMSRKYLLTIVFLVLIFLLYLLNEGYGRGRKDNFEDDAVGRKKLGEIYRDVEPKVKPVKQIGQPDYLRFNLDDTSVYLGVKPKEPIPLLPNLVPTTVHFLWCSMTGNILTFKPYLTILAAIKAIDPSRILFHFDKYPDSDKDRYHHWLEDLVNDFPRLILYRMRDSTINEFCKGNLESQRNGIVNLVRDFGGIYVGFNTWLLDFHPSQLNVNVTNALRPNSIEGYFIMRQNAVQGNVKIGDLHNTPVSGASNVIGLACRTADEMLQSNTIPSCLVVMGQFYQYLLPRDLMQRKNLFGRVGRKIFYGSDETPKPTASLDTTVPNIGHMVWFCDFKETFVFYLGVLSMLFVVKVDKVYVHGDCQPRGIYWKKLKGNPSISNRVVFVSIIKPTSYYQRHYPAWLLPMYAHITKIDILARYGGYYLDADAVWVKPFNKEELKYDVIASLDWAHGNVPFPDAISTGVVVSKRDAPFWRLVRYHMREDCAKPDRGSFVGEMLPYKVWEKYPWSMHIDPHLSVICTRLKCHPTWDENYQNPAIHHVNTGSMDKWWEVTHAVHWSNPDPPSLADEATLMTTTGMFADMGRMIMAKAGLIPDDHKWKN